MSRRSATSIGLGVLAVALAAATVAFWRWELVREPVPGVPLPERSRLLESDAAGATGDEPCQLVVEVAGSAAQIIDRWWPRLRLRQWESVPTDLDRTVFRRPGQRMLVNAVELGGVDARTRLRITLRPCILPARAQAEPRRVKGGR